MISMDISMENRFAIPLWFHNDSSLSLWVHRRCHPSTPIPLFSFSLDLHHFLLRQSRTLNLNF